MFSSGKAKRRQNLVNIDRQLADLSKWTNQIEAGQIDDDHLDPFYIIERVENLSITVVDDPKLTADDNAALLFSNAAELVFQLVTLTLLSLHPKRPLNLDKIYQVLVGRYPVTHLNSRFEFKNPELTMQRLQLMLILQKILDPNSVKEAVYDYTIDRIKAFVLA